MTRPANRPSRVWLVLAGVVTQLLGVGCLVLGLASLPVVHDLHGGMHSVIAAIVAALAAIVAGTLVWRGNMVALALAIGVDIGFGISLPRGGAAIGALLQLLPADDAHAADVAVTAGAIAMFAAAVLCALAIPSALALRRSRLEPQPGEPDPAGTLPGVGPARGVPTRTLQAQAAPASRRGLVIAVVAVAVVAVGVVVIAAMSSGGKQGVRLRTADSGQKQTAIARAASARTPGDAAVSVAAAPGDAAVADAAAPSLDDFAASWHAALARPDDLEHVLDAKVFAFGPDAHDVADRRAQAIAMLRRELGGAHGVEIRFSKLGQEGDVGWGAEELAVGGKPYVVTWVAGQGGGAWTIAALCWAVAVPNDTAYRLARDGTLGVPDAVPDTHDDSPLAEAMRTAFASRPSFVAARSARPDAFNFGSAPGERIAGGEAIAHTFDRLRATIRLHDAVRVGAIGASGGWGAANVDFTDADRDGTPVTQTFRVLAAWLHEDAGWRIVQTQWSNPRP